MGDKPGTGASYVSYRHNIQIFHSSVKNLTSGTCKIIIIIIVLKMHCLIFTMQ